MDSDDVSMDRSSGERPTYMTTLSSVLEKIRIKGFYNEFKWTPEGFTIGTGKYYQPEDLLIIRVYRFEGESDPGDESILYIIKANDELIGFSLDMYGIYSSHEMDEGYNSFIRRIPVDNRPDQILFDE